MTPTRKNLLTGILLGLFLAIAIYYFRATISAQAPSFLIGFLTCLALITSLVIIGGVWFKDQIAERFLGKMPKEAKPGDTIEKTLHSLAQKHLPEATDQDVKSGVRMIQNFLWGRAVYTFLGVLVSIFLVMGGLIGSVLIFKQNELTATQTELIAAQNKLLESQDKKLEQQNKLFGDQNKSVLAQTGLLYAQDTLFRAQNDFIQEQTGLFTRQLAQIDDQNLLFRRQIGQTETEIGLLRAQDSLFRNQNAFVQEQTKLFGTQVTQFDEQNRLLLRQDSLTQQQIAQVEIQNELLQNQIYLSEAERRSSLNFHLGNLLDQIKREVNGINPFDRSLSNETIGRIAGLSQSFRPYRYLDGDTLIAQPLSPERGQLLIALVNSKLSKKTYRKIFIAADFSFAALGGSNLADAYLTFANLREADLNNAIIVGANLQFVKLEFANLSNAILREANLEGANLKGANLMGARLALASFNSSKVQASLDDVLDHPKKSRGRDVFLGGSANLSNADLRDTELRWTDFRGVDLSFADLRNAEFRGARMEAANLEGADLRGANFQKVFDYQKYRSKDSTQAWQKTLTISQLAATVSFEGAKGVPEEWLEEIRKIREERDLDK